MTPDQQASENAEPSTIDPGHQSTIADPSHAHHVVDAGNTHPSPTTQSTGVTVEEPQKGPYEPYRPQASEMPENPIDLLMNLKARVEAFEAIIKDVADIKARLDGLGAANTTGGPGLHERLTTLEMKLRHMI